MKISDKYMHELLNELGIPTSLKGRKYLAEAISICIEEPEIKLGAAYTIIANKFGTEKISVERNIGTAIKASLNSDFDYVKFFGGYIKREKMTCGNYIHGISEYVRIYAYELLNNGKGGGIHT